VGKHLSKVLLVAFAPNDGWIVVRADGSCSWEGIPVGLHNQVNGRINSMPAGAPGATVRQLAIGPNEEWYVRYANGDWRANNFSSEIRDSIDKIHAESGYVTNMSLDGSSCCWLIRYDF
jgi:hypothetical protein